MRIGRSRSGDRFSQGATSLVFVIRTSDMVKFSFCPNWGYWKALLVVLILGTSLVACSESDSADSTPMPTTVAKRADTMTVDHVLRTDDRFSTLVAAVDSTGLDSVLANGGPYTMFAPPNSSFSVLPKGTLDVLLTDRQNQLRSILAHHIVQGQVSLDSLSASQEFGTLSGDSIQIRRTDSVVVVGTAHVLDGDIPVANGLVHVIDAVLRPPRSEE